MKIYLASPWFKKTEKKVYELVIKKMRSEGHDVYVPMEHEIENAWSMSNAEWGQKVFRNDIEAIDNCDEMWVLNFGLYSDSGTAWECGYAYAIGKTVRQLVYDTLEEKPFSLMMLNGCDEYDSVFNYLFNTNNPVDVEAK